MIMLPIFRGTTSPRQSRQRGMSLVEVMVASVVGMLTVLAVTQTMSFSETQRRATTGSGDVQSNVTLATYLLEREARMAGYGVFATWLNTANPLPADKQAFLNRCMRGNVLAYNSERTPVDIAFAFDDVPFVPVAINSPGIPAGDAGSDVLGLAFATSGIGLAGVGIRLESDNGASLALSAQGGLVPGDVVLAVSSIAGTACSLYEVTGTSNVSQCPGAVRMPAITYGTANYHSQHHGCASIPPTRNKPGGLGVTVANYTNGFAFNLGRREGLTYAYYAVRGGRLTRCDHLRSDCSDDTALNNEQVWTPVSDGIVALRAEFGLSSTGAAGAVDTWRTTVCAGAGCNPTNNDWNNLRVLRIAVVGRSQQPAGAGTTTVAPTWGGQEAIDLSALPNWGSFRYVKTEVVIPLRNIVWGASS